MNGQAWFKVFSEGFAPQFTDLELQYLREGLEKDDQRIMQGRTTDPVPLACVHEWNCDGACAIGYIRMVQPGEPKPATIGEVEAFFASCCYRCDTLMGEPSACRVFLNFFDNTPRDEMRRNLIAAIDGVLERRMTNEDRVNAELAGMLAITQGV